MRKLLTVLALVAVLALAVGSLITAPAPADAAGPIVPCLYVCGCNGQVLICCSGSPCVRATGPTPIQCPQVANC